MVSPIVAPFYPPGAMIFKNLILDYIRKLPYKFELFRLDGYWGEEFKILFPI
jgi:hypothetical protein